MGGAGLHHGVGSSGHLNHHGSNGNIYGGGVYVDGTSGGAYHHGSSGHLHGGAGAAAGAGLIGGAAGGAAIHGSNGHLSVSALFFLLNS